MKNTKKILALMLCFLFIALTACTGGSNQGSESNQEATQNEAQETGELTAEKEDSEQLPQHRVIVDMGGNEVEIPNEVNRVVVVGIYPLSAAIANYLGSAEKIVGMDPFAYAAAENGLLGKIHPEILNAKTNYIEGESINIEEVLNLQPDVVFYTYTNKEYQQMFKDAGISAIGINARGNNYNCIETYQDWFEVFNDVFPGEGPSSSDVTKYSNEIYEKIQERTKDIPEDQKVRTLSIFRYTDDQLAVSGENFFGNWWITMSGGINVAHDIKENGAQPIDMERVLSWDPEVILITNFSGAQPEDLYNNAIGGDDWSNVSAVKNKRVFKHPLASYRTFTPGVDTPVTMLWAAKCQYPELFEDIDIEQEFKDYYKKLFNIELSDEDVKNIVNPPREAGGKYQ